MLKYKHLLGIEFEMAQRNCYTLLRDFYRDNYGIVLPDVANPTRWWEHGLDLYASIAPRIGFTVVEGGPREWKPGDVILMAIRSSVGNHVGIIVDGGRMLHHQVGQRSAVTTYGGMYRNNTVAAYRHSDVAAKSPRPSTVDVRTLLPEHVVRKLELRDAQRKAAAVPDGRG